MKVDILLATYNGEKHISDLLNSLLNQTYKKINILIRDDCSTDNTPEILKEYADKYPDIIKIIDNKDKNLGPMKNFEELSKYSNSEYIFFADQDDVWLPEKISVFSEKIKSIEKQNGVDFPILVFCDMYITDNKLNVISKSYFRHCNKKTEKISLKDFLIQNSLLGCVQGFNRALLNKCFPLDREVIMHDWWISLVASLLGKIHFINKPLIYYRQHSANVIGTRGRPGLHTYLKMLPWKDKTSYTRHFNSIFDQAELLLNRFNSEISEEKKILIKNFLSMKNQTRLRRIIIMIKNRFYRHNIHETLEYIMRYKP